MILKKLRMQKMQMRKTRMMTLTKTMKMMTSMTRMTIRLLMRLPKKRLMRQLMKPPRPTTTDYSLLSLFEFVTTFQ